MKPITLIIFLISISYSSAHAQEIYQSSNLSKEYLSLGEINNDTNQYKLLDLGNFNILWLDKTELEQINVFNPEKFYDAIKQNKLNFTLEGYAPFWKAIISENQSIIDSPTLSNNVFSIKVDIDKRPIDGVFLLSFKAHDAEIYGFIRKLSDRPCEIMLTDHELTFEAFINIQGKPYKGCAYIDKASF